MPKEYSSEDKGKAFQVYISKEGSIKETSKSTRIPERTLFYWMEEGNWKEKIEINRTKIVKTLQEEGLIDLTMKDIDRLRLSRSLMALAARALNPREGEEGVVPRSVTDVIKLITTGFEIQDKVIASQPPEEASLDLSEEQTDAINEILLGERGWDSFLTNIRRRKAEAFRNGKTIDEMLAHDKELRQGKTNKEIWGPGDWEC